MNAWAQATYNHSYTTGVEVTEGGDYFLYNIGAKQFLTNGKAYGTQATVDNSGRVLTLTASGTGYKIYTDYVSLNNRTESKAGYMFVGTHYDDGTSSDIFDGIYVDGSKDEVWVFEPVSSDTYSYAYKIKSSGSKLYDGCYLKFNSSDCTIGIDENLGGDNSLWLLVPKITRETKGDYSHYLINTQMNACWELKTWCGSTENNWDYLAIGGNSNNFVGDKYHVEYDINQDVKESVPNGKYKLYAQTSFIDGDSDPAPVLYANDDTQPVALWNATTDGTASMENASTAYSAGKYTNDVTTIVTNNSLRVGVKMTVTTQWVTYDNFVLDYLGSCLVNDAVAFTNGATMTADTWYYYDVPYSISYTVAAGSDLTAIYYTTDGNQLTETATAPDNFSNPQTLTAGRYYFKSSSAQTLTFTPADYATDRTEEVYDFTGNASGGAWQLVYGETVSVDGQNCDIFSNSNFDFKGRFAGQNANSGENPVYWNIYRGNQGLGVGVDRTLAILNLSEGDYVTINYSSNNGNITFTGSNNITGFRNGTAVASGTVYKITSAGHLRLSVPRISKSSYCYIKSIKISTSAPVLNAPTITFSELAESNGLYYTKVTIGSDVDGVTFYDASDNTEITSPYTFNANKTLSVYAAKTGYTNSPKATYTGGEYILANTFNSTSLTLSDFSSNGGSTGYYWLSPSNASNNTTVVSGLKFNGDNWAVKYTNSAVTYIEARAARTISCTVLNDDRMASLTKRDNSVNWLTNTSNSLSFAQWEGLDTYKLFTKSNATVSVTIGSTGYSTFSSPVPLDFSGVDGLTAYVATSVGDDKVTLTSVNSAPANTGLVLKGTVGQEYTIPVTASVATPELNKMVGCIVGTDVTTPNANYYVLVNNSDIAEFQCLSGTYTDNKVTIPAGKAYLDATATSGNSKLRIVFADDESTDIQTIQNSELKGSGEYYNLSGQRVATPQKGLYIVNGKKVLVK